MWTMMMTWCGVRTGLSPFDIGYDTVAFGKVETDDEQ